MSKKMKCPYCGYEWIPRKPNPKKCPNPFCQKPLPNAPFPKTKKEEK